MPVNKFMAKKIGLNNKYNIIIIVCRANSVCNNFLNLDKPGSGKFRLLIVYVKSCIGQIKPL